MMNIFKVKMSKKPGKPNLERHPQEWKGFESFDGVYDAYCDRMLSFHQMSARHLQEDGSLTASTSSQKSASKKLASRFSFRSQKKAKEPQEEIARLHQPQNDPFADIETAYVAHVCLSWEALHCQHTQLSLKISRQPDAPVSYNYSAQCLQQFQDFVERFIEEEPFQQGVRPENYARTRKRLPILLQVPNIKAPDERGTEQGDSGLLILAPDLARILENSILTFHRFLKMDKKKSGGAQHVVGQQDQVATPLQRVKSNLEKKRKKLKGLRRMRIGWKKHSWPQTHEDVQLLFALIDVKVMSRVLKLERITQQQLFWCEEKMKKLDLAHGKVERDPSPILFPIADGIQ